MFKFPLSIFVFSSFIYLSSARSEVRKLSWFTSANCSELTITKYKSESKHDVVATVSTKEKSVIGIIMDRIKALPVDGDKMKSWGPKTKYTSLYFRCDDDKPNYINIYDGHFQTPSTGFNVGHDAVELVLAKDIEAMVVPELNSKLPKIKNYTFKFKDFMITFINTEHTPQSQGGPTVGSTNKNFFSVFQNGSANEVNISIWDGQIPPQPQAFAVGNKIYYLLTYQGIKGESLFPSHFMISEKLPRR